MSRILIADDDRQFRTMLRRLLTDSGHQVRECTDGEYIGAILAEGGTDLVLLDMIMERQGGLETLVAIRRSHPQVPVVLVSGADNDTGDDLLKAAECRGAVGSLRKPFSATELLAMIDRILG